MVRYAHLLFEKYENFRRIDPHDGSQTFAPADLSKLGDRFRVKGK